MSFKAIYVECDWYQALACLIGRLCAFQMSCKTKRADSWSCLDKKRPSAFYLNCLIYFPLVAIYESHKVGAIKINYHLAYRQWVVFNFSHHATAADRNRAAVSSAGTLLIFFHSYANYLVAQSVGSYSFLMNCPQFLHRPLFNFISDEVCFALRVDRTALKLQI